MALLRALMYTSSKAVNMRLNMSVNMKLNWEKRGPYY